MLHAQLYRLDKTHNTYGFEIWNGSNKLHESLCIYTKKLALLLSESVINVIKGAELHKNECEHQWNFNHPSGFIVCHLCLRIFALNAKKE